MSAEEELKGRWFAPELPRRALSAAVERQGELRHAVRVSAAVGASFALTSLLHLPQGYWAVFTAVIVVQTSIGGTITAAIERLMGTVVGGLVGVGAAYLKAQTILEEGLILSAAILILSFAAAVRPSLKVAPITAAIVLVGGSAVRMDPLIAALWRVADIMLGSAIGVAATLVIFPARARRAVAHRAANVLRGMAQVLALQAQRLRTGSADFEVALRETRRSLTQVEQAAADAARENASGFSQASIPEGLLLALWRMRGDIVTVARALTAPLPPSIAAQIAEPSAALLEALGEELEAAAAAIAGGTRIDESAVAQAREAFEEAVERVRKARLTAGMTFEAAARIWGLVFGIESLLTNAGELSDRIDEMAQPATAGAP